MVGADMRKKTMPAMNKSMYVSLGDLKFSYKVMFGTKIYHAYETDLFSIIGFYFCDASEEKNISGFCRRLLARKP